MAITDTTQWPQLWPNNSGSPAALVKGLAAIDIVKQSGSLPNSAGPLEFANWLREPVNYIADNIIAIIAAQLSVVAQPILDDAAASAAMAYQYSTVAARGVQISTDAAAAAASSAAAAAAAVVTMGEISDFALTASLVF